MVIKDADQHELTAPRSQRNQTIFPHLDSRGQTPLNKHFWRLESGHTWTHLAPNFFEVVKGVVKRHYT